MARGGWVMRAVVGQWCRKPTIRVDDLSPEQLERIYLEDVLECDHTRRPEQIASKATALRIMFRAFDPQRVIKRRCHKCGKGK